MMEIKEAPTITLQPAAMPASALKRSGSKVRSANKSAASFSSTEKSQASERKRPSGRFRRAPKSTAETGDTVGSSTEDNADDYRETDDHELQQLLLESLQDCSRQWLRALHMALRKCGSIEARITAKELKDVLQEHNVKVSGRAYTMLVECYEDSLGIDYEGMWKTLIAAQSSTGRDSVMAQNRKNDIESSRHIFSPEQRDADLMRRLKEQFKRSKGKYKMGELKAAFQLKDRNKTGKLKKTDMSQSCTDTNMPVYGALLTGLLERCDEEKSGSASWPEFISFLERAQAEALGTPLGDMKSVSEEPSTLAAKSSARPATAAPSNTGSKGTPRKEEKKDGQTRPVTTPGRGKPARRARSSLKQKQQQKQMEKEKGGTSSAEITPRDLKDSKLSKDSPREGKETSKPSETVPKEIQDKTPPVKVKSPPPSDQDKIPAPIAKELIHNAFKKAVGDPGEGSSKPAVSAAKKENSGESKDTNDDGLKKTTAQVKSATGFFNSMKTLLKGGNAKGKKGDEQSTIPLIQVEGGDKGTARPTTSNSTSNPPSPNTSARANKDNAKPGSPKPLGSPKSQPAKSVPAKAQPAKPQGPVDSVDAQIKGRRVVLPSSDEMSAQISKGDANPPESRLKFEWVYGYRGNDCRSNIYVVKSGEVMYFIGSIVVLLNREAHSQRHYREHTSEIKCMAIHSNAITVATGQMAGKDEKEEAHVRIWRSDSLQTLHIVGKGTIVSSIECLSFSKTESYIKTAFPEDRQNGMSQKERLCGVDASIQHTMFVWDVTEGTLVAKAKTEIEVICDVMFSPKSSDMIVLVGMEHLVWWKVYADSKSIHLDTKADYQTYLRPKFVTCLNHTEKGDLITGDSNGTVYIWSPGGNIISNFIKHAHDGPVFSVLLARGTLLTAGRDGKVLGWVWSKNMDQSGQIEIPKSEGGVRMLQIHKDTLLMGTTTNSILTAKLSGSALRNPLSGVLLNKIPLTQGHFDNVRGVCVPANPEMPHLALTAGFDGIVSMMDTNKKLPLWKHFFKSVRVLCADINYSGSLLAAGTKDSILLFGIQKTKDNEIEMEELCRVKVSSEKLNVIKLSPDCESIAAGDLGGTVHVIGLVLNDDDEECWDLVSQWKAHKTQVVGMDWSIDAQGETYMMRTSSLDGDLLFWNSDSGDPLRDMSQVKNIKWLTHNVTNSVGVVGIWHSKQAEDGDITAVDVSPNQGLTAMGTSNGSVSLFKYPAKKGAFSHTYKANMRVVRAMFTMDSKKLITVGGKDSCVVQWAVI